MSDLLSPILFATHDESESFWCFVALMERLGPNFNRDQNGMHSQLFALGKVGFTFLRVSYHCVCLSILRDQYFWNVMRLLILFIFPLDSGIIII